MRLARSAPTASRSICRRLPRPAFCPTSMRCPRGFWRARSRSISPRPRTRRGQWPTPPILHASSRWPAATASSCSATSAIRKSIPSGRPRVRSNLPGLRVGFVAGDRNFLSAFLELRNVSSPQVPLPAQWVAIAAYADEAHVEENQRLYKLKFDLADQILGGRYGYRRPAGGFLLWLDVSQHGGDEAVTLRLWRE